MKEMKLFGHNEITGKKFFNESVDARAGKLLVTSVFTTLQGEGPYAGVPATFVRLAKCNLACVFCDTYFDAGDWLTPRELVERAIISRAGNDAVQLLVITGGEPALQATVLVEFVSIAQGVRAYERVQVETNGLLPWPGFESLRMMRVVSPKCREESGRPVAYLRPNGEVLEAADCLKFVLSGDTTSPYCEVPEWARQWRARYPAREIYVSPMAEYVATPQRTREMYETRREASLDARTSAEVVSFWEPGLLDMVMCRRNYEYAAQYALAHGLRLNLQMHLFASLP